MNRQMLCLPSGERVVVMESLVLQIIRIAANISCIKEIINNIIQDV